jgi:hypothetical protein
MLKNWWLLLYVILVSCSELPTPPSLTNNAPIGQAYLTLDEILSISCPEDRCVEDFRSRVESNRIIVDAEAVYETAFLITKNGFEPFEFKGETHPESNIATALYYNGPISAEIPQDKELFDGENVILTFYCDQNDGLYDCNNGKWASTTFCDDCGEFELSISPVKTRFGQGEKLRLTPNKPNDDLIGSSSIGILSDETIYEGFIVEFVDDPMTVSLSTINDIHSKAKQDLSQMFGNLLSEDVIDHEYKKVFNGMALSLPETAIIEFSKKEYVKRYYPNLEVKTQLAESSKLVGVEECEDCPKGNGITVGVIDTGIDYTHPDFGSCTSEDFKNGQCDKIIGGFDFVNNDNDPIDDNGHGTHVAGIIGADGVLKGIAPKSKLYAYKVIGSNGAGTLANIIAAIERSVDPNQDGDKSDHLDIISISLGAPGDSNDPVSVSIDNAVKFGVVAVVAAGNNGPKMSSILSPATAKLAITVGATYDQDYIGQYFQDTNPKVDTVTSFSSRGPLFSGLNKPDIVAPGAMICSSRFDNIYPEGTNAIFKPCIDERHVDLAGTSMATPIVSGMVAQLLEKNPELKPDEVKSLVRSTAKDLGYSKAMQGFGRVDLTALLSKDKFGIAFLEGMDKKIVSGNLEIKGKAKGKEFEKAELKIDDKLIESFSLPRENILSSLDTTLYRDGEHTIYLTVTNDGETFEDSFNIEIQNLQILKPIQNEMFSPFNNIEIQGVLTEGYTDFSIELLGVRQGVVEKEGSRLGYIDLNGVSTGGYSIVAKTKFHGREEIEQINILIDNNLRQGWPIYHNKEKGFALFGGIATHPYDYYPLIGDIDDDGLKEIIFGSESGVDGFLGKIDVYNPDGSLQWSRLTTGRPSWAPAIGDVTGDGNKEIAFGLNSGNKLIILDKNGKDVLSFNPYGFTTCVVLADINGDGQDDIISTKYGKLVAGSIVKIRDEYRYSNIWEFEDGNSGCPVVGDLNNDGDLEIVFRISGGKLVLLDNNGKTLWIKDAAGSKNPIIVDLNGDGKREIVMPTYNYPDTLINVYDYDGNNVDPWPALIENSYSYHGGSSMSAGDIDLDGKPEVMIGLTQFNNLGNSLFAINDDGTPVPGFPIGDIIRYGQPVFADINSDGKGEIIVNKIGQGGELVMVNIDKESLPGWPKLAPSFGEFPPVITDLDNNGKVDIIGHNSDFTLYAWEFDYPLGEAQWPSVHQNVKHTSNYHYKSSTCDNGDCQEKYSLSYIKSTFDTKVKARLKIVSDNENLILVEQEISLVKEIPYDLNSLLEGVKLNLEEGKYKLVLELVDLNGEVKLDKNNIPYRVESSLVIGK